MIFAKVNIENSGCILGRYTVRKMLLTILFSLFTTNMMLMQFLPHKSWFTGKSTMKSIEMWNHRLYGTGRAQWYLSRNFLLFRQLMCVKMIVLITRKIYDYMLILPKAPNAK